MKETDYEFDSVDASCDYCGTSENFDFTDYSLINKELKSKGWIITKVDGSWVDFCCKKCYEDYRVKWQL